MGHRPLRRKGLGLRLGALHALHPLADVRDRPEEGVGVLQGVPLLRGSRLPAGQLHIQPGGEFHKGCELQSCLAGPGDRRRKLEAQEVPARTQEGHDGLEKRAKLATGGPLGVPVDPQMLTEGRCQARECCLD